MAYDFVPMRVIVKGEENKPFVFLPKGNYITINGVDSPLSHCGTLEMPLGYCDVMVHTPPPNSKYHVEATTEENQLYYLELELDSQRNIVNSSFGVETITEDPFGLYEHDFKQAIEYRSKVMAWRSTHKAEPEPKAESYVAPKRKGGKLIGWGLAISILCILGIVFCYTGKIEMDYETITEGFELSNLAVYYGGAVLGLILFVLGLARRNAD